MVKKHNLNNYEFYMNLKVKYNVMFEYQLKETSHLK